MTRFAPLLLALVVAGCGRSDDAPAGGASADEARQLNQAAAAIDINATHTGNTEAQP